MSKRLRLFLYFSKKQMGMFQENDLKYIYKELEDLWYAYYDFRISIIYKSILIAVCFVLGLTVGCLL